MNAEELIDEVIGIVDDPDHRDREAVLARLNEAQKAVAARLMLPDLNDGTDTVDTVTDDYKVALPATYHQNLYLAFLGNVQIDDIYNDMQSMALVRGGMTTDAGDIEAVCVHGANLLYQKVPTTVTTITLHYYRNPVPMTDKATSSPDGAAGNDDYEWALVRHAAAKIFNKIEDGLEEGGKPNTKAQMAFYEDLLAKLDIFAESVGKSFPKRPSSGIGWLGVK